MSGSNGAVGERLRPARAGIVNIWDYTEQVFEFADGRLVLRGSNGSGKTKALEVLFPFLLDANLSARRLDPFGEGRAMRDNLLARPGRDSAVGYVWLEFTAERPDAAGSSRDRVCVIGAGLSASRQRDGVRSWFFVARRATGDGWRLVDDDRRPLSRRQLATELEGIGEVFEQGGQYRAAVDRELFGLGAERYAALVQLVLYLRQPQLAKELDLDRLSATLANGFRPLDADLVEEAARSFEDLEATQRNLERLERGVRAVDTFLQRYRPYVRTVARARVDRLRAAQRAEAAARLALVEAERARDRAIAAERAGRDALATAEAERDGLTVELAALERSDAFRDAATLAELHKRAADARRSAESAARRADASRREADTATRSATAAAEGRDRAVAVAGRALAEVRAAGDEVGIEPVVEPRPISEVSPAATDELTERWQARQVARRDDVRAVREMASAWEAALGVLARAEEAAEQQRAMLAQAEAALTTAESEVAAARAELGRAVDAWALAHALVLAPAPGVAEAVRAAVATLGDEGALTLAEACGAALRAPRGEAAAERARMAARVEDLERRLVELAEERERIASERDDEPAAPPRRSAERAGRAGAPLWQAVDFAPSVTDPTARARLEAALEAAGLLDAWISPEGGFEPDGDTWLAAAATPVGSPPSGAADGRTLAAVLVPDPPRGSGLAAETVAAILEAVPLATLDRRSGTDTTGDDTARGPAPARGPASAAGPAPLGARVAVDPAGGFVLGPLAGRAGKDVPEYIGATARAERRARRLAELDERTAAFEADRSGAADAIATVDARLAGFEQGEASLPDPHPLRRALDAAIGATGRLVERRADARRAEETLAEARPAVTEARARLDRTAQERALRPERDVLDAAERGVERFGDAARSAVNDLRAVIERRERAEGAAAAARAVSERSAADDVEAREAGAAAIELAREVATVEDAVGVAAKEVMATITAVRGELGRAGRAVGAARTTFERDIAAAAAAAAAVSGAEAGLDRAVADRRDQVRGAGGVEVLRRADLGAVLGIVASSDASGGPGGQASRGSDRGEHPDPEAGAEAPGEDAAGGTDDGEDPWLEPLLAAVEEATAEVAVSDERLRTVTTQANNAYQQLDADLAAAYHPTFDTVDGVMVVSVGDDAGVRSVAEFATQLRAVRDEQQLLLTARERQVFQETLLDSLGRQVHDRLVEATDQVSAMNEALVGRTTSSGKSVQLRWVDADDGERAAVTTIMLRGPDLASVEQRERLRAHFTGEIRDQRAGNPGASYREILASVLDYRSWKRFVLRLVAKGERDELLTRPVFNRLSGGEKATVLHLPLFAAAAAHYSSARPSAPRLVALDEAFAGIDAATQGRLLALTADFGLDLFLTGHDLWGAVPELAGLSIYHLDHDQALRVVDAIRFTWNGRELERHG